MKIADCYGYLVRARRDLWATLEMAPEDVLTRTLIGGPRFQCVKDLLFHMADVEDGWTNGDIRRQAMVQEEIPILRNSGPDFSGFPLALLLDYARRVEQSTLGFLGTLSEDDEKRIVEVDDWPGKQFTLGGLLWHVAIHEMRHSAQIAMLLRTQGVAPPALDLLFYLPFRPYEEDRLSPVANTC